MAGTSEGQPGPGSSTFEVEDGKGAEDDDRPFVGNGTKGGAVSECMSKNCKAGDTGMMVTCVILGAVVGLVVNVSVSDREVNIHRARCCTNHLSMLANRYLIGMYQNRELLSP